MAGSLFVIDLQYTASLDKIDAHMSDHMKFLNECYKRKIFLASGRKVPRTGGIILAYGKSKEEFEAIMQLDPFCARNLSAFNVTEFLTSQFLPAFKVLLKEFDG